ncbi:hypothetical protein chiPu_0026339 [Chiloscyllium punctatum]|uniref:Uncharacterized protein n=1 Tax=Chiloscyllium punctatum TaxID=137246 RepID=A0A401TI27_CHIPU|nr:hypothetical protein [Chiloscyllium punctatum]
MVRRARQNPDGRRSSRQNQPPTAGGRENGAGPGRQGGRGLPGGGRGLPGTGSSQMKEAGSSWKGRCLPGRGRGPVWKGRNLNREGAGSHVEMNKTAGRGGVSRGRGAVFQGGGRVSGDGRIIRWVGRCRPGTGSPDVGACVLR